MVRMIRLIPIPALADRFVERTVSSQRRQKAGGLRVKGNHQHSQQL